MKEAAKCPYVKEFKQRRMKPVVGMKMWILACASCEYDAPDIVPPRRCPKCNHDTFYRRPMPGSLFAAASRN